MNSGNAEWSVQLNMDDIANISCEPPHDSERRMIIAAGMTGKAVSIRVRDNGPDFQV